MKADGLRVQSSRVHERLCWNQGGDGHGSPADHTRPLLPSNANRILHCFRAGTKAITRKVSALPGP